MRLPTGNGTKEDFDRRWYIPDGGEFGYDRGGYLHSGVDLNLKTGGDTDLGQEIRTITKGKLEYYHKVSHPTYGFGRHNVYRIDGPWGTRWIGNCHCQEKDFLAEKRELNEGDLVARIGKSGTGYAHLHLTCFKVDPIGLDRGIDTIARTRTQLDNWFEDPLKFIDKWMTQEKEDNMPNWLRTMFLELGVDLLKPETEIRERIQTIIDGYKRYGELKKKVDSLQKELEGTNAELGGLEKRLQTIEKDRGEAEKEVAQLKKEITARDKQIEEIDRKLKQFDGKVALSDEEYERLISTRVLSRYTVWVLIKEIFGRIKKQS